MINLYKEVGERIMMTRTMRGYTRECLAELAGISSKFLYEIECGKKGFTVRVFYDLCKALDVDSDYILTGKENVVYDHKLMNSIDLFDEGQMERIGMILKEIHELIKVV